MALSNKKSITVACYFMLANIRGNVSGGLSKRTDSERIVPKS